MTGQKLFVVRWHKQKLSVVLQQKRQLVQEKETQPQKRVLKAEGVRVIFYFFNNIVNFEIMFYGLVVVKLHLHLN